MLKQINIDQAKQLITNDKANIVDIRDPASFAAGHIESAVRIDNDNVQAFVDSADKSVPLIVCCYHGNSSKPASEMFASVGFDSYSLDGGMAEWVITNAVVVD
jgi:thiosulfate sulfurtransferase